MNNEMLDELYSNYIQSSNYEQSEEKITAENILHQNYGEIQNIIGNNEYSKIENLMSETVYESEHYGFVMGIKYGLRLMSECLNPTQQNT